MAGIVHKGSQGLNRLKALPPRLVFDNLFAALATSGLEAAAAAAVGPGGSEVLVTGVRQVEELTKAAFCQPTLSRSQLTKLCQVRPACLQCQKDLFFAVLSYNT